MSEERKTLKFWVLPAKLLFNAEFHATPIYQKLANGNRTFKFIGIDRQSSSPNYMLEPWRMVRGHRQRAWIITLSIGHKTCWFRLDQCEIWNNELP